MKKIYLQLIVLVVVFYLYSFILISNYTDGDQRSYRALYDALSGVELIDVLEVSRFYITASDPLSFYILWSGARLGIDKDVFISLANVVLLSCLFFLARRYRANYLIVLMLMSNFYVVVLMTGAERLKFAFIFVFLAMIVKGRFKKIVFLVSAVFSHLQTIILLASFFMGDISAKVSKDFQKGAVRKSVALGGFFVVLAGFAVVFALLGDIDRKADQYSNESGIVGLAQVVGLFAAGLVFLKNRTRFIATMLPLVIAVILLGGQRVNMIAVMLVIFLFWLEGKVNHPFMYIVMLYFSVKSIPFIKNIMEYGNGFYGV